LGAISFYAIVSSLGVGVEDIMLGIERLLGFVRATWNLGRDSLYVAKL